MSAIERSTTDSSTAWAATSTGRLFISHNIDVADPIAVTWTWLDDDVTKDPGIHHQHRHRPARLRSGLGFLQRLHRDHANHSGTRVQGLFSNGSSAWTNVSGSLADLPVNDLVRDDANGDLYAATDFGVLRKASGSKTWALAAPRHAER